MHSRFKHVVTVAVMFLWSQNIIVSSFPYFRTLIPNSNRVMSPCIPLYLVPGVGHKNPFGGGDRNQFGLDFKAAGLSWTTALCNQDSDGDGMTNGQELGDPMCTWTPGDTESRTRLITHPGYNNFSPGCFRRFLQFIIDSRRPRPTTAAPSTIRPRE